MVERANEGRDTSSRPTTGSIVSAVKVIPDLVYTAPGGRPQLLDLYLPQGVNTALPVILWLHGGGWRIGDRHLAPDLARYFAERGFAMASIDYRLSGEAIFPAQIHDVKAAIRWLRAGADRYGFDGDHIGVWGSSAGGHLAALAGLTGDGELEDEHHEHMDQSSAVQAVVDGYGPTDFLQQDEQRDLEGKPSDDPESIQLPPGKRSADADSFEAQLLGAPILICPERVRAANPITYVKHGAPPFLILHGLSDTAVPAHQSVLLYEALAAQDNEVTLYLVQGLGHGFLNRNVFDKGEPRPVTVRSRKPGIAEQVTDGPPLTFAVIEAFFRQHLR